MKLMSTIFYSQFWNLRSCYSRTKPWNAWFVGKEPLQLLTEISEIRNLANLLITSSVASYLHGMCNAKYWWEHLGGGFRKSWIWWCFMKWKWRLNHGVQWMSYQIKNAHGEIVAVLRGLHLLRNLNIPQVVCYFNSIVALNLIANSINPWHCYAA